MSRRRLRARTMSAPAVPYQKLGIPRPAMANDGNKLLGTSIDFPDGSTWKLIKALSIASYQQAEPPFEATQVFECSRVADPKQAHRNITEAVVKVRYQVKWLYGHKNNFREEFENSEAALEQRLCAEEFFNEVDTVHIRKKQHRLSTTPVTKREEFNERTIDEVGALQHFSTAHSYHTPHLMAIMYLTDVSTGDSEYMPGGYVVYMLMTKLPAKQLTSEGLASMTVEGREEIRRAFKVAWTDILNMGILVRNSGGLRRIMWSEKDRKCYIVDFESYFLSNPEECTPTWRDSTFESWGLEESEGSK